jgi:exopolysaccharide biosynthesis protein
MKVFYSNEKTAEEYLAEGVRDVLCFGPLLIRDGELNEEGLSKYGSSRAERVAVGMVEKGHYYFMMLEGRVRRSKGDNIRFLAEKLLEKGCVVGFNLDGGQTAGMMFMGHQICRIKDGNKHYSSRITCDILGVGYSELLPGEKDPW